MHDEELLSRAFARLGVVLTPVQAAQFMTYRRMLLEWNEKINLTAVTDPREVLLKHFADCAPVAGHIVGRDLLDVGSGAGFPGVAVKILRPEIRLTLIDALNKRVKFLRALTDELGLDGVECLHARAEDAARGGLREGFDTVTARAVAALPALAEYCLPLVKPGGRFIAMKGPAPEDELAQARPLILALGGGEARVTPVAIPFTDITHSLIVIEKRQPTPTRFPRGVKKIGT